MPVTVQPGDSLWSLAARTLGDGQRWSELYTLNRDQLSDPNRIEPGQVLRLPGDPPPAPAATTAAAPTPPPQERSWTESASQAASDLWSGFQRQVDAALDTLESNWGAGWQFLQDRGDALEAKVRAAPESFQGVVEGFLQNLSATRAHLVWLKGQQGALSPERQGQLQAVTGSHNTLARAFLADVQDGQDLSVGVAPLIWVGVVGVGVTAVTLAVAQYETAQANRTWSETVRAETEARIQASAQGRSLPPSTLPAGGALPAGAPGAPPPASSPSFSGSAAGWWLVVGLGLTTAAALLPPLFSSLKPTPRSG